MPRRWSRELERLGAERLVAAGALRDAIFMRQGITFDLRERRRARSPTARSRSTSSRGSSPARSGRTIKRGLAQRIRALNSFVDDVYHEREIIRAGIVPWTLVASRSHFARAAHGIRPPRGVYTHIAGCDLVRDGDGGWKVLEDNVRTPSGISYMLENRIAMTRLIPSLFAHYRVRPIDEYPALLHAALRWVAPVADGDATVVVWTPGPANSAYFEHAFIARQMGVELVEASDLVVRDDVCYMRTTNGLARVNAIYRRLDDAFIDPLEFRPDSLLGVPGLIRAYRAGTVAIVNAIGTGVADDKAVYCYVPEMIRFYLGEEPLLENVTTYLLDDPEQLEAALARIDQLVFKPTGESGGSGVVIGPATDDAPARGARAHGARGALAVDRAGGRAPLDGADRRGRRHARLAPRRPAAVRDLRRADPHRPRRPDARRARAGLDDRQLLARRRLQGHLGARGRRASSPGSRRRAPRGCARRRCPTCAWGPGPGRRSSSSSSRARADARADRSRALLARAQRLARRAHRADDRRRLPGRPPGPPGGPGRRHALLGGGARDHGGEHRRPTRPPARRPSRCSRPTPANANSVVASVNRAREGARTVRDVISAEMWEAINSFHLGLADAAVGVTGYGGPYSFVSYVKSRSALFWGVASRTMLRDEAYAFLDAGGRFESADMVLRMLRVALPRRGEHDAAPRDGQALALLGAVGGLQAFRRARAAAPTAAAVARFLLYTRSYPDSVAASIDAVRDALELADANPRASGPVLRLSRVLADLEFRARAGGRRRERAARGLRDRRLGARARRRRHRRPVLWGGQPPSHVT